MSDALRIEVDPGSSPNERAWWHTRLGSMQVSSGRSRPTGPWEGRIFHPTYDVGPYAGPETAWAHTHPALVAEVDEAIARLGLRVTRGTGIVDVSREDDWARLLEALRAALE